MPNRFWTLILPLFCTAVHAQPLERQPLERQPWWGTGASSVADNDSLKQARQRSHGLWISQVRGGTAAFLAVQPDDILLTLNGDSVATFPELRQRWRTIRTGQPLTVAVDRQGQLLTLTGKAVAKPYETDPHGKVIYDQVAFRGGQLRVIINKPHGEGKKPAVLFVPGYTCSSVDNLSESNPYGRIIRAFSEAGYVVLRAEKSGLGDSEDTPPCESTDLHDEIAGFEQGLKKLMSLPYVDTTNLFIFGHSMGGIIASALSARYPLKGVVVYGTTVKSWFEYQVEMCRVQELLAKPKPVAYEQTCQLATQLNYAFYIDRKPLEQIAQDPAMDSLLRTSWEYDGRGHIFGRHAEYWRQIQYLDLYDYWKNTTARVLVLYGESDFQAFSRADHDLTAYTVNYYRPGSAQVVAFPETDHFMAKIGSRQDAFDAFAQGEYQKLYDHFNTEVPRQIIHWADSITQPHH